MRAFLILILVAALLGAAGYLRPGADSLAPAAADAAITEGALLADSTPAGSDRSARVEVEPPAEAEASAREPSPATFHQWIDERGTVHFAASLDEVPSEWRARAGQVELESAAFTRTASTSPKPTRPRSVVEVASAGRAHDVTVYTAPWCGWCRKTLAFLDERGVDYVNKDIESDPRHGDELREKTGGSAIPFVEIDGNPIRGFDPQQMAALLD